MLNKLKKICYISLLLIYCNFINAQKTINRQDSFTVFIQLLNPIKEDIKVNLSYNINYPVISFASTEITLNNTSHLNPIKCVVPAREIQICGKFLTVNKRDTIQVQLNDSTNKVEVSENNNESKFYNHFLNNRFIKRYQYPPNVEDFSSLKEYITTTKNYYENESIFIDSFFKNNKELKYFFLNQIHNQLITALLSPYIRRDQSKSYDKRDVWTYYQEALQKMKTLPREIDNSYRILMSTMIYFSTDIQVFSLLNTKDYENAERNAKIILGQDVFVYWTMCELDKLSRNANEKYNKVAQRFITAIRNSNLSAKNKATGERLYRNFESLSKPIYSFADISVIDSKNTKVKLGDKLQNNKPTLIDFWATWCGPCLQEFPYFDSLKKEYASSVNFISLSVDNDKKSWLHYVNKGVFNTSNSFVIDNLTQNKLLNNYNVVDLPRFILFDKNGKCISANFIRPSNKNFVWMLNDAIK